MKIGIVGGGYVGLVTAACLANVGHHITCIEIDGNRISDLKQGKIPIHEPGLDELILEQISADKLSFHADHTYLVDCELIFLAVGTPPKSDGSADTQYIFSAIDDVINATEHDFIFVTKSTVPVGTNRSAQSHINVTTNDRDIKVVSNPEFLREGNAIFDFQNPDRIIIGGADQHAIQKCKEAYKKFENQKVSFLTSAWETAELIKYASNAFLATKITFINELASLAKATGADILKVSEGMGLDKRIGNQFLQPGPGYGGSCFPKDTLALQKTAKDFSLDLEILNSTINANAKIKDGIFEQIVSFFDNRLENKRIAILGVAFKKDTDDIRDSVALTVIPKLLRAGAKVTVYDPVADITSNFTSAQLKRFSDPYSAVRNSNLTLILTDWDEFKCLNLQKVEQLMDGNTILDTRHILHSKSTTGLNLIVI